jgi:hypothetical protein
MAKQQTTRDATNGPDVQVPPPIGEPGAAMPKPKRAGGKGPQVLTLTSPSFDVLTVGVRSIPDGVLSHRKGEGSLEKIKRSEAGLKAERGPKNPPQEWLESLYPVPAGQLPVDYMAYGDFSHLGNGVPYPEGTHVPKGWNSKSAIRALSSSRAAPPSKPAKGCYDPQRHGPLYGIPATAFKAAITAAAMRYIDGLTKSYVSGIIWVLRTVYPLPGEPQWHEELVRLKLGSSEIRYRGWWPEWAITLRIRFDTKFTNAETVVNLLKRAGMSIGVGDKRTEKGPYDFGMFVIDKDVGVVVQPWQEDDA